MNPSTISQFTKHEVVVGYKHMVVSEAARLMREQHVGCVVVVEETDGGRLAIGMLTDRDIVISVVSRDLDARTMAVGEIMSTSPLTAREDDASLDAINEMRRHGVRRLPIVKHGGTLAGIVTLDDLLEVAALQMHELASVFGRACERNAP